MTSTAPRSAPQICPVLGRENAVESIRLLDLAFEESTSTFETGVALQRCPKSVPAHIFKKSVRDHAIVMGMVLPEDEQHLWIAEESLFAPIPEGWVRLEDEDSRHSYYYNQASGNSTWDHPRAKFYIDLCREKKGMDRSRRSLDQASPLMPPQPPPRTLSSCAPLSCGISSVPGAPKYAAEEDEVAVRSMRYGEGAEEPTGGGDSACDEHVQDAPNCFSCSINSDDVRRLQRQLQKSKEGRNSMAERHDQALNTLEHIKEHLEEKVDMAAEELRQEQRRLKASKMELAKAEKMAAKFRDNARQLEERLESEVQQSRDNARVAENHRNEAEVFKRRLLEASAQAEAEASKRQQEFHRQVLEVAQKADQREEELEDNFQDERHTLNLEVDQIRAKMKFEVEESVREEMVEHRRREQSLIQDLEALRYDYLRATRVHLALMACSIMDAFAGNLVMLREGRRTGQDVEEDRIIREELDGQIASLKQKIQEANDRSDALTAELIQKNKLVDKGTDFQRAAKEAQEGLRAAHNRFDSEIERMNTDLANAEGALDKRIKECKELADAAEDAKAAKERAEAIATAERAEVNRLSLALVSAEASLTEARSKVELLSRQLKNIQQSVEASQGLEMDVERLKKDAEETARKVDQTTKEKDRNLDMYRAQLEEGDALVRKLRARVAEAEGKALLQKGAADRLAERLSSLEVQVLEGRAELSCAQVERKAIASELATAREGVSSLEDTKAAMEAEARAREERLRIEIVNIENTLKTAKAAEEREKQEKMEAWKIKDGLSKRLEGAEARFESLHDHNKDVMQKLVGTEQRFHEELDKSKEREAQMWAQLQEVSTKFADVTHSNKEGESAFEARLGDMEHQLRQAEKQASDAKTEYKHVRECAERKLAGKEAELNRLWERLSSKKEKFAAQKVALERESEALNKKLSEARLVEEGMRARYLEVSGREESTRSKLSEMQEAKAFSDQEAARACAEAAGLRSQLSDLKIRFENQTRRVQADAQASWQTLETAPNKKESGLCSVEKSKQEVEAKCKVCKVLQETIDQLRTDLARLSSQVAIGSVDIIDRDSRSSDSLQPATVANLKLKIMEAQAKIQRLSSRAARLAEEKHVLKERALKEQVSEAKSEQATVEGAQVDEEVIEENEGNKRRAECAQEEAKNWKAKFESERALRRALNAKVLDIQGSIRVLCRLRPLNHSEVLAISTTSGTERDVNCEDPMANIAYPDEDKLTFWGVPFQFDYVFGPSTKQAKARILLACCLRKPRQVFDQVQPMVSSALEGYRVCVFAYGQTGSGKTFTMEGPKNDRGVNFRALGELFALSTEDDSKEFKFRVSMLEVYNESIKDLLMESGRPAVDNVHNVDTRHKHEKHDIRVDKKGRVYVEGLVESEVATLKEVEELVVLGGRNRTVGSNNVNEHSSRSHLVLQVYISSTDTTSGYIQHGQLNLIDLAGSERIKSTAAEGQQLKEAQNINRSLSALGDVINALGSGSKHVPYRNSKLTFLLQDSLSSNAKVLMFVNINPAPESQGESLCSLNFAKRCRSVQLGASRRMGTR
ncbi:unnamed protein product [Ascophyllum nodosum]